MNINRLRWASRRGMLELDLILSPFLEKVFPQLDEKQQALYEKLMYCEDQDLYQWLLQRVEPEEPEIKTIVEIIRANTGIQADN